MGSKKEKANLTDRHNGGILRSVPEKLRYEILGLLYSGAGLFVLAAFLPVNTGVVGSFVRKITLYGFGAGCWLLPLLLVIVGVRYMITQRAAVYTLKFWSIAAALLLSLALFHGLLVPEGQELLPAGFPDSNWKSGGVIPGALVMLLRKMLGVTGTNILLACLDIAAIMLAATWSITDTVNKGKKKLSQAASRKQQARVDKPQTAEQTDSNFKFQISNLPEKPRTIFDVEKQPELIRDNTITIQDELPFQEEEPEKPQRKRRAANGKEAVLEVPANHEHPEYRLPKPSLLNMPQKVRNKMRDNLTESARLLEETLASFGVEARVVHISNGPTVTRFELQPAAGVKVSRITNLADDIALKFAVAGVRIEAPIPGKAAIGIEVPNRVNENVCLREIIESAEFQSGQSPLTVGLGKDIAGNIVVADLAKMPHLLVAGSTGSGKSVCINALISSVLFRSRPDQVKFIMIDPKMVELTNYNGIPHLLVPVVTDAEKASSALRWAVQEMDKRYAQFAHAGVRDVNRFNETTEEEKMPLIVVIIDELADLMMVAPVDVEDAICRLAQKARAAGIHLVLATQRPSVDVITGTIRNNIPSRIAFAVSSQIDSRTILDNGGAEKLLGKGDMLFSPFGVAKPRRVQGVYVADNELERLIEAVKTASQPEYQEEVTAFIANCEKTKNRQNSDDALPQDEYLERAVQVIMDYGSASTSLLQRKLGVGYSRAARLIDTLEEMKIISAGQGSKAREIIMPPSEVYEKYFGGEDDNAG